MGCSRHRLLPAPLDHASNPMLDRHRTRAIPLTSNSGTGGMQRGGPMVFMSILKCDANAANEQYLTEKTDARDGRLATNALR